jgi:phosphoribosylamine-glycine ligase
MKKILVILLAILNSNICFTITAHAYNKQSEKQLQKIQSTNSKNTTKEFVINPNFYLQKGLLEDRNKLKIKVVKPMRQKIEANERSYYRWRLLKWSIIFSALFISRCLIFIHNNQYENFVINARDEWIHVNQFLV